jgi:hypothetical protein
MTSSQASEYSGGTGSERGALLTVEVPRDRSLLRPDHGSRVDEDTEVDVSSTVEQTPRLTRTDLQRDDLSVPRRAAEYVPRAKSLLVPFLVVERVSYPSERRSS